MDDWRAGAGNEGSMPRECRDRGEGLIVSSLPGCLQETAKDGSCRKQGTDDVVVLLNAIWDGGDEDETGHSPKGGYRL